MISRPRSRETSTLTARPPSSWTLYCAIDSLMSAVPDPRVETTRLDVALVARGLARSRGQAHDVIRAHRVLVDGHPAHKPAQLVTDSDEVTLIGDVDEWVGRAAYKLIAALDAFGPSGLTIADRHCLDVGASTGGFTQVLLSRGAAHVVALDVGHGQLALALATDPRVDNREGRSIRDARPADFERPFDVVVGDVSFISLRLVLPVLPPLMTARADLVVLVKPQFEVGRSRLGKGGIVTSPAARRDAVRGVIDTAMANGLTVRDLIASPLTGASGNREYAVWLAQGGPPGLSADDVERTLVAMEASL